MYDKPSQPCEGLRLGPFVPVQRKLNHSDKAFTTVGYHNEADHPVLVHNNLSYCSWPASTVSTVTHRFRAHPISSSQLSTLVLARNIDAFVWLSTANVSSCVASLVSHQTNSVRFLINQTQHGFNESYITKLSFLSVIACCAYEFFRNTHVPFLVLCRSPANVCFYLRKSGSKIQNIDMCQALTFSSFFCSELSC